MTKFTLPLLAAAVLALPAAGLLSCDSAKKHESPGQFIDNSVITAKVKTAFLEDPSLRTAQIGVTTYKDTVQLSGFVDSTRNVRRAGDLAAGVKGVSSVKNDLIVK
jgi:osmotically-inducible protein OsmY